MGLNAYHSGAAKRLHLPNCSKDLRDWSECASCHVPVMRLDRVDCSLFGGPAMRESRKRSFEPLWSDRAIVWLFLPLLAGLLAVAVHAILWNVYDLARPAWAVFEPNQLSWVKADGTAVSVNSPGSNREQAGASDDAPTEGKKRKGFLPREKVQFQLDEAGARTLMCVSDFLMLAGGVALAIQSFVVVLRYLGLVRLGRLMMWVALSSAIVFMSPLWSAMTLESSSVKIMSQIESRALIVSGINPASQRLDQYENGFVFGVALVFTLAMGSVAFGKPHEQATIVGIAARARDAVELLNTCAVFLLVGVFHLWTQWNWPTTLLTSELDRVLVKSHSNAKVFEYGVLLTITLAAVYFTVHWRVRRVAHDVADGDLRNTGQPVTETAIREYLFKGGIPYDGFFDFATFTKVLSPMIAAGPVTKLLELITS